MTSPPNAQGGLPAGGYRARRNSKKVVNLSQERESLALLPPFNNEAEESVLGACLISEKALAQVREVLSPSDFYSPRNEKVFRAILALAEQDKPVDPVTLGDVLRRDGQLEDVGGKSYLFTLVNGVPTPGSAMHYASTVKQCALRRDLIDFSHTLGHAATVAEIQEAAVLMRNFSSEVDRRIADDDDAMAPLRGCSAAELMQMDLPEPNWVVPGLIPEGLSLLAGKPKIGKSWLGLGIAVSVAAGGRALGQIPLSGPAGALYLALEDNPRRLKRRLEQILQGEPAPRRLRLEWEWPKLQDGGLDKIRQFLEQHPGTKVVVIDTLQKIRGGAKSNSNLYAEDYEALGALKLLADRYETGVMVVHHLRKPDGGDALDQVLGTTGMTGVPDTILTLKRERSRADGILYVTGRDVEEAEWALRFDLASASWVMVGNADDFRRSSERQAVIDLLKAAEDSMTPKDVAEALDRTYGSTGQSWLQRFLRGRHLCQQVQRLSRLQDSVLAG